MRSTNKKFHILLLSILFIGCVSDNDEPKISSIPITEPLSKNSGKIGDIIVIKGENFSESIAENIVKFNEVLAEVLEATTTSLKIKIPKGATTGDLTITINGQTIIVDTFIIEENEEPEKIYLYSGEHKKLVSIDPETGQMSDASEPFEIYEDDFHPVYIPSSNEIVGIGFIQGPEHMDDQVFIKVDLQSGKVNFVDLKDDVNYGEVTVN